MDGRSLSLVRQTQDSLSGAQDRNGCCPKRTRLAFLTKPPLQLADDLAYGTGVWFGCIQHRTLDPLLPAKPWKLARRSL